MAGRNHKRRPKGSANSKGGQFASGDRPVDVEPSQPVTLTDQDYEAAQVEAAEAEAEYVRVRDEVYASENRQHDDPRLIAASIAEHDAKMKLRRIEQTMDREEPSPQP